MLEVKEGFDGLADFRIKLLEKADGNSAKDELVVEFWD